MLFHHWKYSTKTTETSVVRPDGCCDLIVALGNGTPGKVWLTDWDKQPRLTQLQADTTLLGFRLRPGTRVNLQDFPNTDVFDPSVVGSWIENASVEDQEETELIEALARPGTSVAKVARQNGTTVRTLQRWFHKRALPSPDFWRLLGRARHAALALSFPTPLAEIADAHGYSDQAHMTREFTRWFGHSPKHLQNHPETLGEITQPGLGNWVNSTSPSYS